MPRIDIARTFDWDTFTRRYWNKRPVLYRDPGVSPFNPTDVFEAAAGASHHALRQTYAPHARTDLQFTIDRLQQVFLEPWLPHASDGSLEGYNARIARQLGPRKYALVISSLYSHGFELWERERSFFAGLWRRVGLPLTGAITTLFHGNYEHSPVGVHMDRFTTFLFALQGRKRMRFWPRRPWKEPVATVLDYQSYLGTSFVAEVEPGDILYWPASYYHVGESASEDVATSVNVGIPLHEHQTVYYVEDLLRGSIDEDSLSYQEWRNTRLAEVDASPLVRGALEPRGLLPRRLPPVLREALEAFGQVGERRAARRHIQALCLKRLSAGGFEPVPSPLRTRALKDEDWLRADPDFPILLEEEGAGRWLCAANGHALRGSGNVRGVARLFQTLKDRPEVRVGELLRPFRSRSTQPAETGSFMATREGMRGLLERLQALRALHRLSPVTARATSRARAEPQEAERPPISGKRS